jgi:hypothetical protein
VLIILFLVDHFISKSSNKILSNLIYQLEKFNYIYVKAFYDNKNEIYRLDKSNINSFFYDKKKFIQSKYFYIKNYDDYLEKLYNNIKYFESLIKKDFFDKNDYIEQKNNFKLLYNINLFVYFIRFLIIILTL